MKRTQIFVVYNPEMYNEPADVLQELMDMDCFYAFLAATVEDYPIDDIWSVLTEVLESVARRYQRRLSEFVLRAQAALLANASQQIYADLELRAMLNDLANPTLADTQIVDDCGIPYKTLQSLQEAKKQKCKVIKVVVKY